MIRFDGRVTIAGRACDLHIDGAAHRILGLCGPSGCGKTSLLLALAGHHPLAGRLALGDDVVFDTAVRAAPPAHQRRIAMVFQDDRLWPHRSVAAHLAYALTAVPSAERRLDLATVAAAMGLTPLLERSVATLSGGERRRVGLGRALLCHPRLLLCDEPLTGLDRQARGEVLHALRAAVALLQAPMLYVSHELDEILALTPQLAVMDADGSIVNGTVQMLASAGRLLADPGLCVVGRARRVVTDDPRSVMTLRGHDDRVQLDATAGDVLFRIAARDVALSSTPHAHSSYDNHLNGRVVSVSADGPLRAVIIDIGLEVIAVVSQAKIADLDLVPGREIGVQFTAEAFAAM